MEFISQNYYQTTTQIAVNTGSVTAGNLLYRDETLQWQSADFANDATTASLTWTFDTTQTVSRIGLIGLNWKSFDIYYNGVTANTFSFSNGNTTTSQWSNNSESSMYLQFTETAVSSVTIEAKSTQVANSEKALSYIHFGKVEVDFDRIPNAKGYNPMYRPKEIKHKLSDGGTRIQYIDQKFGASIKLKYISKGFRDTLYSFWKSQVDFGFVPFGTAAGWDNVLHTCVWPGNFDFFNFGDDNPGTGFNGTIKLEEVT